MSLAALFVTYGTTKDQVSAALGLDPALFDRIDQGVQPFPLDLVDDLASVSGIAKAEIIEAAGSVTLLTGPTARKPRLPPVGAAFRPVSYAKTQPVEA
jgi:hypothetical protein